MATMYFKTGTGEPFTRNAVTGEFQDRENYLLDKLKSSLDLENKHIDLHFLLIAVYFFLEQIFDLLLMKYHASYIDLIEILMIDFSAPHQ